MTLENKICEHLTNTLKKDVCAYGRRNGCEYQNNNFIVRRGLSLYYGCLINIKGYKEDDNKERTV